MRNMSFAVTTKQMINQTKTVTRRFGWWFLKKGDLVQPVKKCMGLKKGEKIEKLCPPIVIVKTERILIEDIPICDIEKEGFGDMSYDEFLSLLKSLNKKNNKYVNRIEFKHTKGWKKNENNRTKIRTDIFCA